MSRHFAAFVVIMNRSRGKYDSISYMYFCGLICFTSLLRFLALKKCQDIHPLGGMNKCTLGFLPAVEHEHVSSKSRICLWPNMENKSVVLNSSSTCTWSSQAYETDGHTWINTDNRTECAALKIPSVFHMSNDRPTPRKWLSSSGC